MPTIKDRLDALQHGLTLIHAALSSDDDPIGREDQYDVVAAVMSLVPELTEHVYWTRVALPADVLAWPALTDDDKRDQVLRIAAAGGVQ